jgi:hypothetical protein
MGGQVVQLQVTDVFVVAKVASIQLAAARHCSKSYVTCRMSQDG